MKFIATAFKSSFSLQPARDRAMTTTFRVRSETSGIGSSNVFFVAEDSAFTQAPSLTLVENTLYTFELFNLLDPFIFTADPNGGPSAAPYLNGVVSSGSTAGTVQFIPTSSTPRTLYYQSQTNANVGGLIKIEAATPAPTFAAYAVIALLYMGANAYNQEGTALTASTYNDPSAMLFSVTVDMPSVCEFYMFFWSACVGAYLDLESGACIGLSSLGEAVPTTTNSITMLKVWTEAAPF